MNTEFVKTIFYSTDLPGSFLVAPVKAYHRFFAERIQANAGLAKTALVVANVISGIFAYTILGFLALIGMLINPLGISSLRSHNQKQIETLSAAIPTLLDTQMPSLTELRKEGGQSALHSVKEVSIAKTVGVVPDYSAAVQAINACTDRLQQVNVAWKGRIDFQAGTGTITIELKSQTLNHAYMSSNV